MKNLLLLTSLAVVSLGFSSCCSMFGIGSQSAGYRTETRQVKTCKSDIVTEQVLVSPGSAKSPAVYETVEKKVPRYKTVTKKVRVSCGSCVRFYCPKKGCCGTTSDKFLKMTTAQGSVGSPHIGLTPSMRPLAP